MPKKPRKPSKIVALPAPSWPDPSVPLDGAAADYRDRLLDSCAASRAVIPSDFTSCDLAARMWQTSRMWAAKIDELHLLGADVNELAKAQSRFESSTRSHRSAVQALGFEGRRLGSKRAKLVANSVGTRGPGDKWEILDDGPAQTVESAENAAFWDEILGD